MMKSNTPLGAQKYYQNGHTEPGIQFSVYAPHAQKVEVVFGLLWKYGDPNKKPVNRTNPVAFQELAGGYIADDGTGIDPNLPVIPLFRSNDGCWLSDSNDQRLASFADWVHVPYMFRVTKNDGSVAYRTDLYSRRQIGAGFSDPKGLPYEGMVADLDGSKSCSIIVDPDRVTEIFDEGGFPKTRFISQADFWKDEFSQDKPLPQRLEDLVIYQLHIPSLGFGRPDLGNVADAIQLLDHLEVLGVNAVELLPVSEYGDAPETWGYTPTHHFAVESSSGGRDKMKHFVREAHRRGIAVIFDVVYNHYAPDAERAEWMYDSNDHEKNIYYWYHGHPFYYNDAHGGYLDNISTGFAPRYFDPLIRNLFIASAVTLLEEFHIDGFRVDQTSSIRSLNCLHADGSSHGDANQRGTEFLQEWTTAVRTAKPNVFLTAEDHSYLDDVTRPVSHGGLGFDAVWYSDFHHHLTGATKGSDYAKLIPTAGYGGDAPLAMNWFTGALMETVKKRIVYHISHDEAGNAHRDDPDFERRSHRTLILAVRNCLNNQSRPYAEARSRVAFGVTLFSAGTPLFLFGEEVAFQEDFLYDDVRRRREDIFMLKQTVGKQMFDFYRNAIQVRNAEPALRSRNIEILHCHNDNRMLAFRRWEDEDEMIVVVSLNNHPFGQGYIFDHTSIPSGHWNEIINSDDVTYGGNNLLNNNTINTVSGSLEIFVPANGIVVLKKLGCSRDFR